MNRSKDTGRLGPLTRCNVGKRLLFDFHILLVMVLLIGYYAIEIGT